MGYVYMLLRTMMLMMKGRPTAAVETVVHSHTLASTRAKRKHIGLFVLIAAKGMAVGKRITLVSWQIKLPDWCWLRLVSAM
jgi:hypothetical protein